MNARYTLRLILCAGILLIGLGCVIAFATPSHPALERVKRPSDSTSFFGNNDNTCTLPQAAEDALLQTANHSDWNTWNSDSLKLQFRYPPAWTISETPQRVLVVPSSHERSLPYRGDGDHMLGISISTSTDVNGLGPVTSHSVLTNLELLHFPMQTRWMKTQSSSALLVYCIFGYSEGITALFPLESDVLQISLSRFAEGTNSPEDWATFFGILESLVIAPVIPR